MLKKLIAGGSAFALATVASHATIVTDIQSELTDAKTGAETVLGGIAVILGMFVLVKLVKRAVGKA